jgi:hypothetical protein
MAKPEPIMVSPTAGILPDRKAKSATKIPRIATPPLLDIRYSPRIHVLQIVEAQNSNVKPV